MHSGEQSRYIYMLHGKGTQLPTCSAHVFRVPVRGALPEDEGSDVVRAASRRANRHEMGANVSLVINECRHGVNIKFANL